MDSKPNVLIIDDDPRSRGDLKGMVQALGFEAILAVSAEAGLDQCDECPPLAVITHLSLPHLSGLQATYHLKARCPQTRVLLITENDPGASGRRLRDMGVDVLLQAPVNFSTLRLALWRIRTSDRPVRAATLGPGDPGAGWTIMDMDQGGSS